MIELIKTLLTIIGGLVVLFKFLEYLPKMSSFKAIIWEFLAERFKHRTLHKRAIESNIESTVNDVVSELNTELPKNWVNRVVINWVRKELPAELKENEIILRIKPFESQDYNLLNGIYFSFSNCIFPLTKEVVPHKVKEAAVLQITKRTIIKKLPALLKKFEKEYIEREVTNDTSILNYYGKYEKLDSQGFFTGFALREIDKVAELSRYDELRIEIDKEINLILDHIINLQKSDNSDEDSYWFREGAITKYGYLLVARPFHTSSVSPYVKRAEQHLERGVERLYIMGCNREKNFVEKVIKAISKIPGYHLVEIFSLHKDYRCEKDGIGALLITNAFQDKSENQVNEFFNNE